MRFTWGYTPYIILGSDYFFSWELLIFEIQKFPNMLESAYLYLQMNNDKRRSWNLSPYILLHLKQIYRLKKRRGKAVILTMKRINKKN